ncbi:uncharacterized protein ACIBXB_006270 [Morphnus guianensis]
MGQNMSSEERAIVRFLLHILSKRGIKCTESSVRGLLKWCRVQGYPAETATAFEPDIWAEIGTKLRDAVSKGDQHAEDLVITWRLLFDNIRSLWAERKVAAEANSILNPTVSVLVNGDEDRHNTNESSCSHCPSDCTCHKMTLPDGSVKDTPEPKKASPPILPPNPEKEIRPTKPSMGLYPPLPDDDDNWSEPPRDDISLEKEKPPPSYDVAEDLGCDPRSYWREIHKKAASKGVVVPHAYPVIVRANNPNEWNPFSWDSIKEVRKSVHNYGLTAPFTEALLDNIFGAQLLTPYDCDQLASMLLKPTQKMWRDRWRGLCEEVTIKNLDRPDDDPMKAIGIDHLIGTGKFTDPRLQARFPIEALRTASVMAFKAMTTLPEEGRNVMSFTQIKQGPQESYMSFIDRLRDAVTKQVSSVEAQNALALKLAVENANADCKKLLMALPRDASLVDMVEACNKLYGQQRRQEKQVDTSSDTCVQLLQHTSSLKLCQRALLAREQRPSPPFENPIRRQQAWCRVDHPVIEKPKILAKGVAYNYNLSFVPHGGGRDIGGSSTALRIGLSPEQLASVTHEVIHK